MSSQRAAVIVHPARMPRERLDPLLREVEHRHGWQPSLILETTSDDPGAGQTAQALEAGVDLVIAAGGDGTVRQVVGQMLHSDTPLALLPVGTGNLLARNLGLNLGPGTEAARAADNLEIAFGGRDRVVDAGIAAIERADGHRERHAFAVLAGLGVDAAMIDATDEDLKQKIGWLAYIKGMTQAIGGGASFSARFRLDGGGTFGTRAAGLMIGNCGELQAGVVLLPDAVIDDGRLDILLLRPRGPVGWMQAGSMVVTSSVFHRVGTLGRRLNRIRRRRTHALKYLQGREIALRLDSGPVAFEVDGDTLGDIVAARVRVLAGALRVRVR